MTAKFQANSSEPSVGIIIFKSSSTSFSLKLEALAANLTQVAWLSQKCCKVLTKFSWDLGKL
jgi:hypothetical protein